MFNPEFAWFITHEIMSILSDTRAYLRITFFSGHTTSGERDSFVTIRLDGVGGQLEKVVFLSLHDLQRFKNLLDLALSVPDRDTYVDGEFGIRSEWLKHSTVKGSDAPTLARKQRMLTFTITKNDKVLEFSKDDFLDVLSMKLDSVLVIDNLRSYPPALLFDRALAYVFMRQMTLHWEKLASGWSMIDDELLASTVATSYDVYAFNMRKPMQKICSAFGIPHDIMRRFSKATLVKMVKEIVHSRNDCEGYAFISIAHNCLE